ncbi:MAG TPA: hypothetical protein VJT49_03885 [Amycolatopsis sp.]|nr:hypothetical protein [Amycolatopsis sp.]
MSLLANDAGFAEQPRHVCGDRMLRGADAKVRTSRPANRERAGSWPAISGPMESRPL